MEPPSRQIVVFQPVKERQDRKWLGWKKANGNGKCMKKGRAFSDFQKLFS
jgi:hypothetical protein